MDVGSIVFILVALAIGAVMAGFAISQASATLAGSAPFPVQPPIPATSNAAASVAGILVCFILPPSEPIAAGA